MARSSPARRQAQAQHGISGDGQTAQAHFHEFGLRDSDRQVVTARTIHFDAVSTPTELSRDDAKRHRDAVDLRRKGFSDDCELHVGGEFSPLE